MRKYLFNILNITEQAAIAASYFIGKGDKISADQAATDAMRKRLQRMQFKGIIKIGEGEKDNAPQLYSKEIVGTQAYSNNMPYVNIAVDPLDGTTQTAKGGNGATSIIAFANYFLCTNAYYMKKVAYGTKLKSVLDNLVIEKPYNLLSTEYLELFLEKLYSYNKAEGLTVCMLDRPRNQEDIERFRKYNWNVKLIQDGDVTPCIQSALQGTGIDLYYGIGGAPEGVLAAAVMKCLKGEFEGLVVDNTDYSPIGEILKMKDLVTGDVIFSMTGVTNGELLKGITSDKKTNSFIASTELGKYYFIS